MSRPAPLKQCELIPDAHVVAVKDAVGYAQESVDIGTGEGQGTGPIVGAALAGKEEVSVRELIAENRERELPPGGGWIDRLSNVRPGSITLLDTK